MYMQRRYSYWENSVSAKLHKGEGRPKTDDSIQYDDYFDYIGKPEEWETQAGFIYCETPGEWLQESLQAKPEVIGSMLLKLEAGEWVDLTGYIAGHNKFSVEAHGKTMEDLGELAQQMLNS